MRSYFKWHFAIVFLEWGGAIELVEMGGAIDVWEWGGLIGFGEEEVRSSLGMRRCDQLFGK
jgi:hypothetical protein